MGNNIGWSCKIKCLERSIDKCLMSTLSNTTKSGVLNDKFISECVNFPCISHVNI